MWNIYRLVFIRYSGGCGVIMEDGMFILVILVL